MKKIIALVITICSVVCCITFGSAAEDENTVTFYYRNGVEVTAELNDDLTYDQIKSIADRIAGEEIETGDPDSIMTNPQCAAGNHLLTYTSFSSLKHNVSATSPKCRRYYYTIATCTRIGCEYENTTLTKTEYITDCHG